MKILFVSPWFPAPPVNGSKQRIYHLLRALAERHEVHLISFVRQRELIDPHGLEDLGIEVDQVPYREFQPGRLKAILGYFSLLPRSILDTHSEKMKHIVRKQIEHLKPDLLIFSEQTTAAYCPVSKIPAIFDDLELSIQQDKWDGSVRPPHRWRYWFTWRKQGVYLRRLLPRFSACTVVSDKEEALLKHTVPDFQQIKILPNGVDLEYNQPGNEVANPRKLIYNGALTYAANFEAVHYFLREIMPRIHNEIEDATLTVTGSTQGVDVRRLEQLAGLDLTGHLEDIRPLMRVSWACVVPLQTGGGTRLKILEAMALGVPVISTPKGAEGLAVTAEENILIADNASSFAAQAIRLMRDADLRARLAIGGRRLVEANYDWRKIGKQFLSFVEIAAGEHSTAGEYC